MKTLTWMSAYATWPASIYRRRPGPFVTTIKQLQSGGEVTRQGIGEYMAKISNQRPSAELGV
jgi:hypothetical protein